MAGAVLEILPLGFPWVTADPFLFCVHHNDAYPAGNEQMGPATSLAGRALGQDFGGKDGWSMYHGEVVPGFPQHPHRGFETVTIVRKGYIDHSDSLGATARFGSGDVQWLTAGGGIVHSEMFPLLQQDQPNPVELFQIWLNLPSRDKLVEPHFAMLWDKEIPRRSFLDDQGRETLITVVAGKLGDAEPPSPPPHSWASRIEADVAIWSLRLAPGAVFTLPPTLESTVRTLYFFRGTSLSVAGERLSSHAAVQVQPDVQVVLENGSSESELLMLQGRPIAEPVAQHGPFVMNTRAEIQRAMQDYQQTRFGGWPWSSDDPVHGREAGRFAKHADGKIE
ncbi:MAG TPA: pirin family protein, partial [Polyangiaceae bacterium]